jgi:NAD(P)-dependent dehydrogenase (short-subunit alcohol dehydrogenase family)
MLLQAERSPEEQMDGTPATARRLEGRVAVVSGGTSGIGEAIVRRLQIEGATVAFCGRDAMRGNALAQQLHAGGTPAEFTACDVSSKVAVAAWIDGIADRHGRLDAVVTCAGIAPAGPLESMQLDEWNELMQINVTGTFLVCQSAIPHLRASGGGSIVTLGSTASFIALPGAVAYGITKAAALSLAKGLALELASDGIRVNALCPGATLTPASEQWFASLPDPSGARAQLASAHPIGRMAWPHEIAAAAAFLLSDDASFVSGSGLLVDGAYTAR